MTVMFKLHKTALSNPSKITFFCMYILTYTIFQQAPKRYKPIAPERREEGTQREWVYHTYELRTKVQL